MPRSSARPSLPTAGSGGSAPNAVQVQAVNFVQTALHAVCLRQCAGSSRGSGGSRSRPQDVPLTPTEGLPPREREQHHKGRREHHHGRGQRARDHTAPRVVALRRIGIHATHGTERLEDEDRQRRSHSHVHEGQQEETGWLRSALVAGLHTSKVLASSDDPMSNGVRDPSAHQR